MNRSWYRTLALYVPNRASPDVVATRAILPASAIVSWLQIDAGSADPITVYYEGNAVRAVNIVTYGDRVRQAADALVRDFPTSAKAPVPAAALLRVGTYDYPTRTMQLDDERALAVWLGFEDERVPWNERRPSE